MQTTTSGWMAGGEGGNGSAAGAAASRYEEVGEEPGNRFLDGEDPASTTQRPENVQNIVPDPA